MTEPILFSISVSAQNADAETLEYLSNQLSNELGELNDLTISQPPLAQSPEEGAKGLSPEAGKLVLSILGSGGITALVTTIGSWLSRDRSRTITVKVGQNEMTVSGMGKDETSELIQWFKKQSGITLEV